jgi:hypothetical protein
LRGTKVPWAILAQGVISVAVGAFVVGRATHLSLTYDEAAAYIRYIAPHAFPGFDGGPLAVFNFEVATNHFLATVAARLVTAVAGGAELALRVPALAGLAMYLWFSARMLRERTVGAVATAGLLLLSLNPYLLDFFALSRGYGLSLGLMMGALYFLLREELPRTFVFATAAVLANFSMLNVYIALALLTLAQRGRGTATVAQQPRGAAIVVLPIAAVFAALVFSQDPHLSASLYDPVAVEIGGLTAAQLGTVSVSRVDLRGRASPLSDARVATRAVRIEMPSSIAKPGVRVEAIVGNRAFSSDLHQSGAWTFRDNGATGEFESGPSLSNPRSRTREFQPVINWAGDRRYAIAIARAAGLAVGALALLALLLALVGARAVRTGVVRAEAWQLVSSSALWVAALAGPPLYLLKRDAQLYFGGTRGLVQDTFYSLIDGSFYGVSYHANQTQLTFIVLLAMAAAFGAFVLAVRGRDAARVLAILAIVSVALVAQRWLLGTVYLIGRTALLFIPLYLLFFIFSCAAVANRGRAGWIAGTSILLAAVALSAWHFTRTANLSYTFDWRDDAATKRMMADLEREVAAGSPGRKSVLGVEWNYAPVAAYYAQRHAPSDVDVVVAPSDRRIDFLYVPESHARDARILHRYPVAGTVLMRQSY